ncbi:GntR family transcriptional regulator [Streptomyces sp. NPDC057580]|uniref:GntR family transcriptional regulator n=1 Tax=Streptomyces sp. NPDC057580 TaxID=3346173 RepID=UPI00367E5F84
MSSPADYGRRRRVPLVLVASQRLFGLGGHQGQLGLHHHEYDQLRVGLWSGPRPGTDLRIFDKKSIVLYPGWMDGPIQPTKISDQIASRLRDEIISGVIQRGEPLRLVALADRLGVSTTPVREALASLERQGLVVGHAHRGFRVADLSPTDFGDAYTLSAFMHRLLAERAADRLSEQDLDELEALDEEMRTANAAHDMMRAADLNHEIHRRICQASDSPLLLRFLRETTPFVTRRQYPDVPGWFEQRSEGHGEVLRALRKRDGSTAGRLMEEHVLHSGRAAVAFVAGQRAGTAGAD